MSKIARSIESMKRVAQGLRQEWDAVKPTWISTDRDQWERKHIGHIESVFKQHLSSLDALNDILDQAHRDVQ